MDLTRDRRSLNGTKRRRGLASNNLPNDVLPPRTWSELREPIQVNDQVAPGEAGKMPICHLGTSLLYPTRYVRGKATMSWKHYLNNASGRGNRMRETVSEARDRFPDPGVREKRLPRGKAILTKLCDGAAPQKRVYCDLPKKER
jgi:hypothetical protein